MGKCKIKVNLSNKVAIELDSDNPDIRKLVEKIVDNRDKIVLNDVKIECKESNFDSKGFEKWDVSNANSLTWMFRECSNLKEIESLMNCDVSNCNNFSSMFYDVLLY